MQFLKINNGPIPPYDTQSITLKETLIQRGIIVVDFNLNVEAVSKAENVIANPTFFVG